MVKKILVVFVVLLVVFLVVVAMQPNEFTVTRSTVIAAPPAAVFPHVNDLHQWEAWNPWETVDPEMKTSYEGAAEGVGAVYKWDGNNDVGAGSTSIVATSPPDRIGIVLAMVRPMEASNDVEFTFTPEGEGTKVTWTMSGKKNFLAKGFHLFMDMDQMVGGMFEKGLASLKTVVETPPAKETDAQKPSDPAQPDAPAPATKDAPPAAKEAP